jgi:hypothetical protein
MRLPILLVVLLVGAFGAGPPQVSPPKVLLIGNSLTIANGLGPMVEALARAAGGPSIETRTVATGGYSLEDHWTRGEARRVLAAGGWSTVILQQGPSSQPASQDLLRDYVRRFDREAKRVGARVALFMVWPPRSGPGTFQEVSGSYGRAARDVHGLLLPVGDAFRAAVKTDSQVALFAPDGFHPTPLGTLLAAIVIHRALTSRAEPFVPTSLESPDRLFPTITLTPDVVGLLRAAADAAVASFQFPVSSSQFPVP